MQIALDNTDWMQYHAIIVTQHIKHNLKATEMKTITTPNFKSRAAKIIADIRNITCIDNTEIIVDILKDALEEYYYSDQNDGYYEGRSDGYALGYDDGYDDAFCGIVAYKRPRQP